jgi:hypothetical protein
MGLYLRVTGTISTSEWEYIDQRMGVLYIDQWMGLYWPVNGNILTSEWDYIDQWMGIYWPVNGTILTSEWDYSDQCMGLYCIDQRMGVLYIDQWMGLYWPVNWTILTSVSDTRTVTQFYWGLQSCPHISTNLQSKSSRNKSLKQKCNFS